MQFGLLFLCYFFAYRRDAIITVAPANKEKSHKTLELKCTRYLLKS